MQVIKPRPGATVRVGLTTFRFNWPKFYLMKDVCEKFETHSNVELPASLKIRVIHLPVF